MLPVVGAVVPVPFNGFILTSVVVAAVKVEPSKALASFVQTFPASVGPA